MKISIRNKCSDFNSYRAARCKSLFNVDNGCNFSLDVDLPIDDDGWNIGLIVGPSGSGKTSIGKKIFGSNCFFDAEAWPTDIPIIDAIGKNLSFDAVTKSFVSVGLGSVPTWLRPFDVLSNGEKFRANLARLICESKDKVVVDEFTSVVDRQVAKVGSYAFSKNWRRNKDNKKCVLLSCHYDIIEWLEPDWLYDIATGKYQGRGLWRRPQIDVKIYQTNWKYWEIFRPHHYMKAGPMPASKVYIGVIDDNIIAHYGVATKPKGKKLETRGGRFVVLPEWQGLSIGMRFVNYIAQLQLDGKGIIDGKKMTLLATTSHPGLARARRRDIKWQQVTCPLHGQNTVHVKNTARRKKKRNTGFEGFGGHFRSVQGFRYVGENPPEEIITRKFRDSKINKWKNQ